jgi:antitoxin PrlF
VAAVTRLTSKHQTTIPLEVRRVLDLEAGDHVEFSIEQGRVSLRKAQPRPPEDLGFRLIQAHAMRDWDTPEDDEAFRDL